MENVYVFEFDVLKYGTGEKLKTYHCLGRSLFEASHIITEFVYSESDEFKREPVEIGMIRRLTAINYIINPEFIFDVMDEEENEEYHGDIPLKIAEQMDEDQVIHFDCECKERLTIPANMGFPFVECPNCRNKIKKSEIKNFGGIWVYEKENK